VKAVAPGDALPVPPPYSKRFTMNDPVAVPQLRLSLDIRSFHLAPKIRQWSAG